MVVDLSRVSLGNWVADGALTVVEQIPGLVEYSDQTQALRKVRPPGTRTCVCVCVCVYLHVGGCACVCICISADLYFQYEPAHLSLSLGPFQMLIFPFSFICS